MGLQPGDRVAFDIEGSDLRLRIEKRRTLEELRGSLAAGHRYPGREAERSAARRYVKGRTLQEDAISFSEDFRKLNVDLHEPDR